MIALTAGLFVGLCGFLAVNDTKENGIDEMVKKINDEVRDEENRKKNR